MEIDWSVIPTFLPQLFAGAKVTIYITVMGLLRRRLRALYLLLAAEGGVRERPYLIPPKDMGEEGDEGEEKGINMRRVRSQKSLIYSRRR